MELPWYTFKPILYVTYIYTKVSRTGNGITQHSRYQNY